MTSVEFSGLSLPLGLLAIPAALLARAVNYVLPFGVLSRRYTFDPCSHRPLIWGGLRGTIGVALAFMVPVGPEHDLFLIITYVVVVFSIVVQGLTVGSLARQAARLSILQGD